MEEFSSEAYFKLNGTMLYFENCDPNTIDTLRILL